MQNKNPFGISKPLLHSYPFIYHRAYPHPLTTLCFYPYQYSPNFSHSSHLFNCHLTRPKTYHPYLIGAGHAG